MRLSVINVQAVIVVWMNDNGRPMRHFTVHARQMYMCKLCMGRIVQLIRPLETTRTVRLA